MIVYNIPSETSTSSATSSATPTSSPTLTETAVASDTSSAYSTSEITASVKTNAALISSNRQSELITNDYFSDATGWSFTFNLQGWSSVALNGQYLSDDQGNTAYNISSNAYRSSKRSLCILQTFTYTKAGVNNLTDVRDPPTRGCASSGVYGDFSDVTATVHASSADTANSHILSVCAVFATSDTTDVLDSFLVTKVSLCGPKEIG
ncbi:hypothetical protein K458DRAFT_394681 [Lentithecium fluviatile CBS 122367]|uniref:Uncharacterized protein n=1 Tax=Lentithecium fluviatile CBS 122367 TaxID=1168545 RepID=A0A6G1IL08_9PLEO|nr:hypothetical protein K458DRAFT_394681 [Lentithecium fluviatile CBS 122367]